jgi:hypothetical protein
MQGYCREVHDWVIVKREAGHHTRRDIPKPNVQEMAHIEWLCNTEVQLACDKAAPSRDLPRISSDMVAICA